MKTSAAIALLATLGLSAVMMSLPAEAAANRQVGSVGLNKCGSIDRPGSYVLTRDLEAQGDCFVINANLVALDLAGHVLSGGGTGAGVSEGGSPRLSVRVTGGTITNFAVALDLGSSAPVEARALQIIQNTGADTVLQCSASPEILGRPSGIITGSNSLVEGNLLRDNVGSTFSGNTAHANSGVGLEATCPSSFLANTAVDYTGGNLVPQGAGCNAVDNLAP